MNPALWLRALTLGLVAVVTAVLPASAQTALDKVSFGTNWIPEAEHGGFFQAVADGTVTMHVGRGAFLISATGGKGVLVLQNTHGVVMKLRSRTKGISLAVGGEGLEVQFGDIRKSGKKK